MKIKIKIIDNITAQVLQGKDSVKELLSFPAVYYRQSQFRKIKTEYNKNILFGKGNSYLYVGNIPRIRKYAEKNGIEFELEGEVEHITASSKPFIEGVEIRDYQLEAINSAVKHQRGVINGATGVGKSLISIGICSCFSNPKVLYLVPNLDLLNQASDGFTKYGYKNCKLGNGQKNITEDVVISTIQTMSRMDLLQIADLFDITILDEAHLAIKSSGTVEKILSILLSPIRIALTGTPPKEKEQTLILEGLTGEIIYNIGASAAIEKGILMNPKIKLLKVPKMKDVRFNTYREYYTFGIVDNKQRNNIVCTEAIEFANKNENVIIFVKEIEHLNNICVILKEKGVDFESVHGIIEGTERNKIKKRIMDGKCRIVVSSVVWTTGLDIPNLSVIILAAGGKSEQTLLQTIGRGLRKSDGKESAIVVDFLDPYKYLSEHCIERVGTYVGLNWL